MRALDSRGLTLTEITVVMVLASLVMFGLVGFYMASQTTWMDASSQALTQREATALLDGITERAHQSDRAIVTSSGSIERVDFYQAGKDTAFWSVWWDGTQKQVFEGPYLSPYPGSAGTSVVEAFDVSATARLVEATVTLRSTQNQRVTLSTRAALNNVGSP